MEIKEKKVFIDDNDLLTVITSGADYLQLMENKFHSQITVRGNSLIMKGEAQEISAIEKVFKELSYMLKRNGHLNQDDVTTVINIIKPDFTKESNGNGNGYDSENVIYEGYKEIIRAKTPKQIEYLNKVRKNDLVFAIGPAGTGKTFLSVAMALAALRNNSIRKIILSRPAVEAGESLGFLPGDLREKLDPYLRPLTDALFYMLPPEKVKSLMEKNIVEIIPLAYMRGRTLSNALIILDEAQNATVTQMKMFLTRLGQNSKAIITGDITQIDLPSRENCGLINAKKVLRDVSGIEFVYFDNTDVVRHRLVADIIRAYEEALNKEKHSE